MIKGLLDMDPAAMDTGVRRVTAREETRRLGFEDNLFLGERNRLVGSGGEILLKRDGSKGEAATRMEVGDRLAGIGITHVVESLSRPPGPEAVRALRDPDAKIALRAFEVMTREQHADGLSFTFAPLSPRAYSETIAEASQGAVRLSADDIPEGTMILSFLISAEQYTLRRVPGSPGANWAAAARGQRHWNVGVASADDFWAATFPSDDIGMLQQMPGWMKIGTIQFGLSLLPGSRGVARFDPVEAIGPSGKPTRHHFHLTGSATGTRGLDAAFPIGLRTEILVAPRG